DYIHAYEQVMDLGFSEVANIELAKLKITSKGSSVSKKVVNASITRASETDTVAESLSLIYDDGSVETLTQCSKDTPPVF
ncbi:MAG: hypothetical protein ACLGGX_12795, partial [Bdellovibrionia bacterium]